jgi:hypothetical protein
MQLLINEVLQVTVAQHFGTSYIKQTNSSVKSVFQNKVWDELHNKHYWSNTTT